MKTQQSVNWLAALRLAVAEQRAARAAYDARDKSAIMGSMLEMALLHKLDEATRAVARAAEGMVDAANEKLRHGSNGLERMVMSHLYDAANEAKARLAAAAADVAAAPTAAKTAFASSAGLAELEAALCMVEGWREDADEESAPVYAAELVWLKNLIVKLVASERGHSANAKDHSPIGAVGASNTESNSAAPIG